MLFVVMSVLLETPRVLALNHSEGGAVVPFDMNGAHVIYETDGSQSPAANPSVWITTMDKAYTVANLGDHVDAHPQKPYSPLGSLNPTADPHLSSCREAISANFDSPMTSENSEASPFSVSVAQL